MSIMICRIFLIGCMRRAFNNLIIVHEDIHRLIHATREETIRKLLDKFNLNNKQIMKLNKLRKKCNLTEINF